MKKTVLTLMLLSVASGVLAVELPDFPFVYASGGARSEVPPDLATISFRVAEFHEDATNAQDVVRDRSATVLAFFAQQGVKQEDITAYEIDKRAVRERKGYDELKILGYEIGRRISVTLRDLTLYEPFIKKLLAVPNVTGIHTEFDRSDRKKIESDLIAKACADARLQAEEMAKGMGVSLGNVFAISQRGFQDMPTVFGVGYDLGGAMYDREGKEREFLFVPSTIELMNSVTVIFKIKETE